MKLELTELQADAILDAIATYEMSYEGWDEDEIMDTVKATLRRLPKVVEKIEKAFAQ